MDEFDDSTVEMAFWSSKSPGIELDDEDVTEAVGYHLETEVIMDWDGIIRLRDLLNNYIEANAPDRYLTEETE